MTTWRWRDTALLARALAAALMAAQTALCSVTGNFDQDFYISWSPDHVNTSLDGRSRSLKLDKESGSGFTSNEKFLFGEISMQIRLIPGYSAGTVVAFYLTSEDPNRDEIDFEFLGNSTGQPEILLQTNIFANGTGGREERIKLWFDPTCCFHTYTILWNIYQIVFMVDWIPIRTYRNHGDMGVPYPRWQPTSLKVSLWDGDSWATRGGLDKVKWSKGPFAASFRNYKIDACVWNEGEYCAAATAKDWWNRSRLSSLSWSQRRLFRWARRYYLVYDYCQDYERFHGRLPRECHLPKY